jgi:c-di-GMP-binding flagellar brake protein YcgR
MFPPIVMAVENRGSQRPHDLECDGMGDEQRRREGRLPVAGTLRLLVKNGAAFLLASGEIVDLSPGGCALRIANQKMDAGLKGRIEVSIAGQSVSLPVVTRWVRAEGDEWIVGCRFFELNPKERIAIHELIIEIGAIVIGLPASKPSVG